jgi:hypothetical protein
LQRRRVEHPAVNILAHEDHLVAKERAHIDRRWKVQPRPRPDEAEPCRNRGRDRRNRPLEGDARVGSLDAAS